MMNGHINRTLKKLVALLAALCLLAGAMSALAEDRIVTYKGAVYSIDDFIGFATFVRPVKSARSVTIPATIPVGGKQTIVYRIADKAFYRDTKITKITIGKNVWHIGKRAFEGCTNLKAVEGGAAMQTFEAYAFKNCKSLAAFTLNKDVHTIGKQTFYGCKALKTFPTLNKLQTIGANAFKGCVKLTKFTLAKNVKSIGKNAFNGCKALKTITVKTEKLTASNVKDGAFKGINSKATFSCPKKKRKHYGKRFIIHFVFKSLIIATYLRECSLKELTKPLNNDIK